MVSLKENRKPIYVKPQIAIDGENTTWQRIHGEKT